MRVLTLIALALVASACSSTVRPRVSLPPTQVEALQAFDYADWTRITTTLVDARGRVDYPKLAADRAGLDRFIALIAVVGPKSKPALFPTREDQLAYYINAYNALTMFNVINRYPAIQSVNDDPKDFFYFTEFELDGGEIDLYSLENKIIRPTFQDARVHFALNCASAGCPVLPAEPFLPATLEAQLSREATRFLHEERNVAVEGGAIVLSQIFEWYAADFTPDPVSWIRAQAGDLDLPATAIVRHRPYDWALNDQSRPLIRRAALALALLAGPAGAVEQLVSGALILHPEGLYVRYDARFPLGGGLSVGVFDSWQVYGNGVGVQLGWQADPAWIETHVDVSAEPGYYVQRPDDARIGPGIDGTADAADRAFGWRGVAAWQTQINLRSGGFWLYSRTTALARLRSFVEADTFQQQQVRHELALDQATAAMGRIAGDDAHAAWWIYGEYTVGGVLDVGTRPHRVSAGVIAERWPADAVTLNLDLFYSVAPSPLDGPGLIAAWWIRW